MTSPVPVAGRQGRFVRLAEVDRPTLSITVDGQPFQALQGDTLLVAMLMHTDHLRHSEFGDGQRSGFCLMGACQDCWVWSTTGERLRACTTAAADGMAIVRAMPPGTWV